MSTIVSPSHYNDLKNLSPATVCRAALCEYQHEEGCYQLPTLEGIAHINLEKQDITFTVNTDPPHEYFDLFLLHYLLGARDTSPSGEWISEKDMAGGVTFFRGPHAIPTEWITAKIENDIDRFNEMCLSLGGESIDMADSAFTFSVVPKIPITLLYWLGDEDFPAEASILYDRTITDHLALDAIYALAISVCHRFSRR